jgi:hypothetical protein
MFHTFTNQTWCYAHDKRLGCHDHALWMHYEAN